MLIVTTCFFALLLGRSNAPPMPVTMHLVPRNICLSSDGVVLTKLCSTKRTAHKGDGCYLEFRVQQHAWAAYMHANTELCLSAVEMKIEKLHQQATVCFQTTRVQLAFMCTCMPSRGRMHGYDYCPTVMTRYRAAVRCTCKMSTYAAGHCG